MTTGAAYDYSSLGDDVALDWPSGVLVTAGGFDDFSSEKLDHEDRRMRLIEIIDGMVEEAPAWDGEPVDVDPGAAATAVRFLKSLPSNRYLPRIAPDGEGGLLLVWEPPDGNCIVTVQDEVLHLLDLPGTGHVDHVDALEFPGNRIPVTVLQAIPFRKVA